jgi:hypothetical protein
VYIPQPYSAHSSALHRKFLSCTMSIPKLYNVHSSVILCTFLICTYSTFLSYSMYIPSLGHLLSGSTIFLKCSISESICCTTCSPLGYSLFSFAQRIFNSAISHFVLKKQAACFIFVIQPEGWQIYSITIKNLNIPQWHYNPKELRKKESSQPFYSCQWPTI